MPRIKLNGESRTVEAVANLADLLRTLDVPLKNLVVEHNGVVLTPEQYQSTPLTDGDTLELVRFVGGG
jgi:sulfur carrier protein